MHQKLLKLLSKRFERSVYGNEYKTKSESKNRTKSLDNESNRYSRIKLNRLLTELTVVCFGLFRSR